MSILDETAQPELEAQAAIGAAAPTVHEASTTYILLHDELATKNEAARRNRGTFSSAGYARALRLQARSPTAPDPLAHVLVQGALPGPVVTLVQTLPQMTPEEDFLPALAELNIL